LIGNILGRAVNLDFHSIRILAGGRFGGNDRRANDWAAILAANSSHNSAKSNH
jgi:hypothetical protein